VDLFIKNNEIGLAMDLIELNPALAMKQEDITWPVGTAEQTLDDTVLPVSLGASDTVYKIMMMMRRDGNDKALYSAAGMSELTGDGVVEERSQDFASSLRYCYDGGRLWLYPVPSGAEDLTLAFVLAPVAQTVAANPMLEQFSPTGRLFAEGIAIRAAFDLRASLGYDLTWIQVKLDEFNERMRSYARSLQMQEPDVVGNTRWNHYV